MGLLDSSFAPRLLRAGVEYVQRKTWDIVGGEVIVADDPANDRTLITIPEANPAHAATHINGGTDVVDGDRLRMDYAPSSGYVPALAPVSTAPEDLASHLHGVASAVAAAQAAAVAAQAAAATALATANAAQSAAGSAALMFQWSYNAFQNGSQRLYPMIEFNNTASGWMTRLLIPTNGTLFQISAHSPNWPGGPAVNVTYTVWLSTDNGVTFTPTTLAVAQPSKSRVPVHATGDIAVSRGNLIGVEVVTPSNIWDNYDRMFATVLLRSS